MTAVEEGDGLLGCGGLVGIIVILLVIGLIFGDDNETDEGAPPPTTVFVSETLEILRASYSWGPSDDTEALQAVLGVPVDGWYGVETRAAHLAELEKRGQTVGNVPPRPTPTVDTGDCWSNCKPAIDDVGIDCPGLELGFGTWLYVDILNRSQSETSTYKIAVLFESRDGTKQYGKFEAETFEMLNAGKTYGGKPMSHVEVEIWIPSEIAQHQKPNPHPEGVICRLTHHDPIVRWDHSGQEHQSSRGKLGGGRGGRAMARSLSGVGDRVRSTRRAG